MRLSVQRILKNQKYLTADKQNSLLGKQFQCDESAINNENLEEESCKCNKVIMIITDGSSENAEAVFKKYNWNKIKFYIKKSF